MHFLLNNLFLGSNNFLSFSVFSMFYFSENRTFSPLYIKIDPIFPFSLFIYRCILTIPKLVKGYTFYPET